MANQRETSYGRAYRFGTDGSAALAEMPVYTPQTAPVHRDTIRWEGRVRSCQSPAKKKEAGVSVPKWTVILAAALCLFMAAMSLLTGRSEMTAMSKQISAMRLEMAQIEQINEGLEIQIEQAADPQRIRTLALNRLGMSMPSEDRVHRVASPVRSAQHTVEMPAETQKTSLLKILISNLVHP